MSKSHPKLRQAHITRNTTAVVRMFQDTAYASGLKLTEIAVESDLAPSQVSKLMHWTPACDYGFWEPTLHKALLWSLVHGKTSEELDDLYGMLVSLTN